VKILIVDDNAMNLKLLRAILEANNHEVLEARDGVEALALMGEASVDAVISDILMPNMDGYRLCYEVRKSERLKNLPFVFYTSTYTSPADEKLCMDLGGDKYVRKPASSYDLFAALGDAIAAPRRKPSIEMTTTDVLKEYSERLVDKLEEKNLELTRKAEELRIADHQLRNVLAYSPAVIYTLDLKGEKPVPTLVSDNMEQLLGIAGKDTDYDWWVSSLHPDDRDWIVEAKRPDASKDATSEEYRIRHVDGTYRWIQDNNRFVRDEAGKATKLIGVWTDITERKEVEAALHKSEERFREILENIDLLAISLDTNGNLTFCNDYFLRLTGWDRAEVLGSPWFERFNPLATEEARQTAFSFLQSGRVPAVVDSTVTTRSGEVRQIHWSNTNLKDSAGNIAGVASIGEDVTERKRAEAALYKSEERFRDMLENVELIAVMVDKDGIVTFCNDHLLRLTNWTREEVLGSDWFTLFVPEIYEESRRTTFKAIYANANNAHFQNPIQTKAGEVRDILWNNTRLRDANGDFAGVASIGEDITERNRATVALEHALSDTERQVEDRTRELAQSNSDLRAAKEAADYANKSKSEFLSRMSHELRTPMNSILGFGQLLEFSNLDEGQRDSVDHVLKAGRHLLKLINEVLEIARIEAGATGISLEPVKLMDVIDECISLMQPFAIERGVQLELAGRRSIVVTADRQRLTQVLLNLISNAVKYNVAGGRVTVRVVKQANKFGIVEVVDTGLGISESMRQRLFTPFERLGAESTAVEGTGLGLTLSKSLMEAMGGTLTVDSTEGVGSTFRARLYLAEDKSAKGLAALQSSPEPSVWAEIRGRVLVIEDNLMNTQLLNRMFSQFPQIELVTAMQGRMGLELARDRPPDAILLDLHLPDMTGRQVLAELKADPNLRDVPVLIITADAFSDHSKSLLEAGAFRYLTKPFILAELISAVASALGKRGEE